MKYFFIGIGGIGMSALARYLLHYGHEVGGYDRVRTPISIGLEELGAKIIYQEEPDLIPAPFRAPADVTVIYTPAIPSESPLRKYYKERGYQEIKRADLLGEFTRSKQALCVAGTHGKTTTSTLLAHLLASSHIGTNTFLGGVSENYQSNLLLDEGSPYVVVEADEYDRSFHKLSPAHAIITSTEPDHLDIYGTPEAYLEAFQHFAELLPSEGTLLLHEDAELEPQRLSAQTFRYGERSSSDYRYSNIHFESGELFFDWHHPKGSFEKLHLGTPITINITNATAAIAIAYQLGCTEEEIRTALSTFRGARRRFQRLLNEPNLPVLIDDYAHHPHEIEASLRSIRELYPEEQILVVFQPHLYSRTADFLEEFGAALSHAEDLLLLPIYPAREAPIPGITSDAILPYSSSPRKKVVEKAELLQELEEHQFTVLIMMGAGDIEFEIPKVRDYLKRRPR